MGERKGGAMQTLEEAKAAFCEAEEHYGLGRGERFFDNFRERNFSRLGDAVYLDYAGAALYPSELVEKAAAELGSSLIGNPHSAGGAGEASRLVLEEVSSRLLSFFSASPEEYSLIFTSGATAAIKLVGENFPWSEESHFILSKDNHTSVLGVRGYAERPGASVRVLEPEELRNLTEKEITANGGQSESESESFQVPGEDQNGRQELYHLLAFPAESNFNGVRYPLDIVQSVKQNGVRGSHGRWLVLLDAAKYVSTSRLDLTATPADFVSISFYKIFGYPTGLGALLVRRDAAKLLKKTYFGGGTIEAAMVGSSFVRYRSEPSQRYSDGTTHYLGVAALKHGLKLFGELGISRIERHTHSLSRYLHKHLRELRHKTGKQGPVVEIYGGAWEREDAKAQGPTLAFNILRSSGEYVGYAEVQKVASLNNILLRTGCFCNPGACQSYLKLSDEDLMANLEAGHVCWDDHDLIDGRPTGAVRVSLGFASSFEDVYRFLLFIEKNFQEKEHVGDGLFNSLSSFSLIGNDKGGDSYGEAAKQVAVDKLVLYPIKSCRGIEVTEWPMAASGLLYDRQWAIVDGTGKALRQKDVSSLSLIIPALDLERGILRVSAPQLGMETDLELAIFAQGNGVEKENSSAQDEQTTAGQEEGELMVTVCGEKCASQRYGKDVSDWFSLCLGRPCTLVRSYTEREGGSKDQRRYKERETNGEKQGQDLASRCLRRKAGEIPIGFANESPLLLVSRESVQELTKRTTLTPTKTGTEPAEDDFSYRRFRPNILARGAEPYSEDCWREIRIGENVRLSYLGLCTRCSMVNIDPETGAYGRETLLELSRYRRKKANIFFGVFFSWTGEESSAIIRVGDKITIDRWD